MKESKNIAFLVLPGATLLDITGPYEVFSQATEILRTEKKGLSYSLHTLSPTDDKIVKTASGFAVCCDASIGSFNEKIDTLFIPGVPNHIQEGYVLDRDVLHWIARQAGLVRRICSVCTGTFFLAEAGLLKGRNVTTHWEMCGKLAESYPETKVDINPIFVKDGSIYTSAGISAGMDLALALVEEDSGRELALEVAKQMVLYLKRQGNQSQFSSVLTHQNTDHRPVQRIQKWILEHLNESLTIERMAEHALMSPRNFARVFVKETGVTPAKYVEKLRIETACRYLTESRLSADEISVLCGLQNSDNMRRLFQRNLKITPSQYRQNFKSAL